MSSMAIGTLIGSTIASKIVLSKYTIGRIQVFATLFFGVTLLANALFVSSKFIIVSLAISFIFLGVTHVSNKPFYQILIPEQHLGKVFSTKASISIITMPLGSLFFGWLSLYINPNIFFILFGSSYCFIGIVYLLDSKIRDFSLNDN
ncbi:MFS transporter [Brochothrix thermosphacta]|nr:MFS transporter [Brochothrix thermosphacta]